MELLVHPDTKRSIKKLIQSPSHAVLIEGRTGAGKRTLANYLAAETLGLALTQLEKHQYFLALEPINSSISIEEVRSAQRFLKLKTLGQSEIRRIVIIERAELMTIEAQNAFLKVLEEPPADTVILLLTNQKSRLLPTITSRVQILASKKSSKAELEDFFSQKGYSKESIIAAYYAANGQIGLMSSLLSQDESSQQLEYIKLSKELLALNKFNRLLKVDGLAKQKESVAGLIQALIVTCRAALQVTIAKNQLLQAKRWHKSLELSLHSEKQLASNPNTKLLLTNLLLNL
jgi:DNA polymerase-3 subunit delta'